MTWKLITEDSENVIEEQEELETMKNLCDQQNVDYEVQTLNGGTEADQHTSESAASDGGSAAVVEPDAQGANQEKPDSDQSEATDTVDVMPVDDVASIPAISDVEDKTRSVIKNLNQQELTRLVWDPDANSMDVPYDPGYLPYDTPEPSAEAYDMFATILEGERDVRYSVADVEFTNTDDELGCTVTITKHENGVEKQLIGIKTRDKSKTGTDHWRERLYSKARRNALKQDIPPTWISALLRQYRAQGPTHG